MGPERNVDSLTNVGAGQYRHEFKYIINYTQLETLLFRLPSIMVKDPHTDSTGMYEVRSLYFDDFYNSCFYENENGTDPREKFRIRIYNASADRISLELKRKESGMTLKRSCPICSEQVTQLITGSQLLYQEQMHPLLRKLYTLQETKGMHPKVIVEYDRIPFVCKDGNVRVTLDMNIRASTSLERFFDAHTMARPFMPVGYNLLEVKYDQFLPDYIKRTVQMKGLRQTAFSKYYLCRRFGGLSI